MPIETLAEMYELSSPTIIKILKQYHVKIWSRARLFSPSLDEDYFEQIDSPAKAYFLGLITTDGCVFWKKNGSAFLTISLKASDRYILEAFMSEIRCNRRLVYDRRANCYTATVSSNKVVTDLAKYAVVPKSSLTQLFPSNIPSLYVGDYLRGLIDGDGSYGFYSRPRRRVHKKSVRMCSGSKQFISAFIECISKVAGASQVAILQEESHLFTCAWYSNDDVEAIISLLYAHGGYCLTRKKEIADKIAEEIRQYRDNRTCAAS